MPKLVDLNLTHHHLAIIQLNRPTAANAMSIQLLDQLNEAIRTINDNKQVRCVIITGAGNKAFCAGADLKERKEMTDEQVLKTVKYIGYTVANIEKLAVPVIAAINGAAFGGGLELALACDLRIASRNAKMGLTETALAIIPGAGGTQRLPRLIGIGQAKRLIFTASKIGSEEAVTIGLIEQEIEATQLMNTAIKMAERIAVNGPVAIKQAKLAINKGMQTDIDTGLDIEHLCYKGTLHTADRIEGLQAFKEKRIPSYQGK